MLEIRYILVWLSLLLLLGLTVGASFIFSGPASLMVSLMIATTKAGLVLWFFMHLNDETWPHRLVAIGGIVWLAILIVLALTDYFTR